MACALSPMVLAAVSPFSSFREPMSTVKPCPARSFAICRPIPLFAPVMRATRFSDIDDSSRSVPRLLYAEDIRNHVPVMLYGTLFRLQACVYEKAAGHSQRQAASPQAGRCSTQDGFAAEGGDGGLRGVGCRCTGARDCGTRGCWAGHGLPALSAAFRPHRGGLSEQRRRLRSCSSRACGEAPAHH